MRKSVSGFTIVELLIVIVVIAILATISIVAYNGIQDRANDSAIKSDLANMSKQIQVHYIQSDTGELPAASSTALQGVGISPTKDAYGNGYISGALEFNLVYCRGTDGINFALVAWSKSGQGFVSVNGGVREFNFTPADQSTTCSRTNAASGYVMAWMYYQSNWRI